MSKRYADIGGGDRAYGYRGRIDDYYVPMEMSDDSGDKEQDIKGVYHTKRRSHDVERGHTVCLGVPVYANKNYEEGDGNKPLCKTCQKIRAHLARAGA